MKLPFNLETVLTRIEQAIAKYPKADMFKLYERGYTSLFEPNCANLALGVAAKVPAISVDIHIHRVVNQWGITQTSQPEQTMAFLQKTIPQEKWIAINRLLMPFG